MIQIRARGSGRAMNEAQEPRQPQQAEEAQEATVAIIDGSNVAHSSEGDEARLDNIRLVSEKLREEGYEPIVVVDAALRHQIDDTARYEELVDEGVIKQAPAGTDA